RGTSRATSGGTAATTTGTGGRAWAFGLVVAAAVLTVVAPAAGRHAEAYRLWVVMPGAAAAPVSTPLPPSRQSDLAAAFDSLAGEPAWTRYQRGDTRPVVLALPRQNRRLESTCRR